MSQTTQAPAQGATIRAENLTKHFGSVQAVRDLSFEIQPGKVTALLGPNGAGKTTAMRMMLDLVFPTKGSVLIGGKHYRDLPHPQRMVGAVLEGTNAHPGRRAYDHLRVMAKTANVPAGRIDEVLSLVGLLDDKKRRAGKYSMGMRQRLQLAGALLPDPGTLILDEPANGLDPEGIAWLRNTLRSMAAQGRTVLISSHILAEVQHTADDVIIMSRGQLIRQASISELSKEAGVAVIAKTPTPDVLGQALGETGVTWQRVDDNTVQAKDCTTAQVGEAAAKAGVVLLGLNEQSSDLEQVFLRLTSTGQGQPQPQQIPGKDVHQ